MRRDCPEPPARSRQDVKPQAEHCSTIKQLLDVIARLARNCAQERAIQYSRDGRSKSREAAAYWMPRSSSRGMTAEDGTNSGGDVTLRSRGTICPSLAKSPSEKHKGAGNAGCVGRTPQPRVVVKITRVSHHRYAETSRHSPRDWF
jgi:hypothetical protein